MNTGTNQIPVATNGVSIQTGRIDSWHVAEEWQDRFGEIASAVDWLNLAGDPRAQLVKANPNRQVWRLHAGGRGWYVKVYNPADWRDRLRCLLRGDNAWHEWQAGVNARSLHVPCVEPVACGQKRQGLGNLTGVLILAEAPQAQPLPEVWRNVRRLADGRERFHAMAAVSEALGDLLAKSHEAGFMHRDGHPGNILLQAIADDPLRALYADLYGAAVGGVVSPDAAAGNLAELHQWFRRHASRSTRLRFLRHYLGRRFGDSTATGGALRQWVSNLERHRRDHAGRLWRKRDRRLGRQGKYFSGIALNGGWRATLAVAYRNPDEFPQPVHRGKTQAQWQAMLDGFVRADAAADAAPPGTVATHLDDREARQLFAIGHGLRHRDVPVVCPVAFLERRVGLGRWRSVLLTERRDEANSLGALACGHGLSDDRWANAAWRRRALAAAGRLLAHAFCLGVRWPKADPSSIWIECDADAPDRPRALVGSLAGWALPDQPPLRLDGRQARIAVADVQGFCPAACVEDADALVGAFRGYVQTEHAGLDSEASQPSERGV